MNIDLIELIPNPFAIIVAVILMYFYVLSEEKVVSFKGLMELIVITYMVDIILIPFLSSDWPATIAFLTKWPTVNALFTEWPTMKALFTEWPTVKAFFTEWPTIDKISQNKYIYWKLIITIIPMFVISLILFKRKSSQKKEKTNEKGKKNKKTD